MAAFSLAVMKFMSFRYYSSPLITLDTRLGEWTYFTNFILNAQHILQNKKDKDEADAKCSSIQLAHQDGWRFMKH